MGIVINKITFKNFRQYGTGAISFNVSDGEKLSVFIAKNGTGKTTLLNAITWCLYGKELHLSGQKNALPVVTSAVVKSSKINDVIPVEVALTITDSNNVVEFRRTNEFKIIKAFSDNNCPTISGHGQLTVTITKTEDFSNTKIKTGVDADIIVKQYFDEAIFKFYFFDGEKLRDFFNVDEAKSIKQSIFNISQITLLENSCERLLRMKKDRTKMIAKSSPDIEQLNGEQEAQENTRDEAKRQKDKCEKEVVRSSDQLSRLENLLRGYKPVKQLQEDRDEWTKKLNDAKKDEKDLKNKKTAFIRKYIVLLKLYPRIKRTLDIIAEKESAGDLPPAIDKDLIKDLMEHPDRHCPVCDALINENALEHMKKILTQFSVSSKTSNYLKEIKGTLESAVDEVSAFKENYEELNQNEWDIDSRKGEAEKRLSEIAAQLSSYESTEGQINVAEIELKRTSIIDEINNANQAIGVAKKTIEICEEKLDSIRKQTEDALKKINEHEELRKQIDVIDMLYNHFYKIKISIMENVKKEIEETTWNYFDKMIWKTHTFGKLLINDGYDVAVYNKEGVEMTGSLSATEQMALAYAFTLAIHEASGKNCPLVIDSPLGRVSDKNREKMAEALKEVSKTKQIIMLFTPDEYSENVRSIYEGIATVRELVLSEDENYVEGIEH